jgi:hypothetical protein
MTIDGDWNLSVKTPMGAQESVLAVHSEGAVLSGELRGNGETAAIYAGTVDGDAVTWKADVTKPFGMTISFTATLDGNSLSGEAQAGVFPPAPLAGERQ